jgi:hypothetical protein
VTPRAGLRYAGDRRQVHRQDGTVNFRRVDHLRSPGRVIFVLEDMRTTLEAGHGKYNAQCYWGAMTTRNSHGNRTPHNNSYCSHLSVLLGHIYMTIALAHSLIFINAAKQRRASPQVAIGAQKHHHLEVHRQR